MPAGEAPGVRGAQTSHRVHSHLERLLEVHVRVHGELPERVAHQVVSAYVQHQVGVPSQLRFQREQHEDVVQVCTADCHLGGGGDGDKNGQKSVKLRSWRRAEPSRPDPTVTFR